MLVLSGCGTSPVDASSTGFWDHYIIWNFIRAIQGLSRIFGHNYGWGIVVFTIIVRIIILPLMIYQMKSMRKTTEIQPQLMALQKKYPDRSDPEQMRMMSEEQKRLYAEAGVNPVAGCLPLLVQMPILIALYQAIFRSETLKTGKFLWMQLGDKDPYYILPILAAIFTFLTSWLSVKAQPEKCHDNRDDGVHAVDDSCHGHQRSCRLVVVLGGHECIFRWSNVVDQQSVQDSTRTRRKGTP